MPGRVAPVSRADHAARLLLTDAAAWEALSHEMHAMLCELPAPHGAVFAWLDSQLHEHGPLPWGSLREALQGHDAEPLALRLMADAQDMAPAGPESAAELRDLLSRMLVERLKAQETEAIASAAEDPTALARYRVLHARRLEIEAALAPPVADAS